MSHEYTKKRCLIQENKYKNKNTYTKEMQGNKKMDTQQINQHGNIFR